LNTKKYPDMSWSLSRHKTFFECKRRYLHSYYTSYGGYWKNASNITKAAFRLKRLTTLDMMFGSSVHNEINRILCESDVSYLDSKAETHRMIKKIRADLNNAYMDSKYNQSLWYENPSNFQILHEMYYNNELPEEKIKDIKEMIETTSNHFMSSKTFKGIVSRPQEIELITAEKFRSFEVDNILIWYIVI
jgi:hypothetical protein